MIMSVEIYNPVRWWHRITQVFWVNKKTYSKFWLAWHNGIDIAFPIAWTKWPLYSPVKWKVILRTSDPEWYGNYIRILTDPNVNWSCYEITMAHLDSFNVKVGDRVTPASKVWVMWNTWFSTWVHLHLWVREKKLWTIQNYYNWYKWSINFSIKEYERNIINIPK